MYPQDQVNALLNKTYNFAVRIVKLYFYLVHKKREFIISKQILRSGTSIGANSVEADASRSQKDFFHKCSIAYKEARETEYWLNLMKDTGILTENQANSMLDDLSEIIKILGASMTTIRNKQKQNKHH